MMEASDIPASILSVLSGNYDLSPQGVLDTYLQWQ